MPGTQSTHKCTAARHLPTVFCAKSPKLANPVATETGLLHRGGDADQNLRQGWAYDPRRKKSSQDTWDVPTELPLQGFYHLYPHLGVCPEHLLGSSLPLPLRCTPHSILLCCPLSFPCHSPISISVLERELQWAKNLSMFCLPNTWNKV